MNHRMGLLCFMLFATACGPESEPATDETGKALATAEPKALAGPFDNTTLISFWEGNNCSQSQAGWTYYNYTAPMIIPNDGAVGWINDEARSLKLEWWVPAGTIIRVYNSPSGSHDDDWAEITILGGTDYLCIPSFQVPANYPGNYTVRYCDMGGLDGKVSQVRAQPYAFNGDTCKGTWRTL
ncbi:hypothetical protein F0U62_03235 [Cystobacter fuscus]|uniref:hypothetical protein n=1 Tax=Cystobacter fuscus TaxID=43 RepID=UPI002B2E8E14|nr:hypothetical protein F0U62_03235 [Cystobacter fuscus]